MTQAKERGGGGEERKETFPSPPLSFIFWFSFHFSRGQNRKSPFAPKPNGNAFATQAKLYVEEKLNYWYSQKKS